MKKLFSMAIFSAALLLSGCGTIGSLADPGTAGTIGGIVDASGAEAPAPLGDTLIDEKGILIALESADTLATAVDMLVAAKQVVPGTPRALTIQKGLIAVRSFLVAASSAQRAGNATTYREAMSEVAKAFKELAAAIRPG